MDKMSLEGELTATPLSMREAAFQMVPAAGFLRTFYVTLKGRPNIFGYAVTYDAIESAERISRITAWAVYQIATSAAIGYGLVKLVERLSS